MKQYNRLVQILCFLFCVSIAPVSAVAQMGWGRVTPQKSYQEALQAYNLHETDALDLLQAHINRFPDSPYRNTVQALKGSCYFERRDYQNALSCFNQSRMDKLPKDLRQTLMLQQGISYLQMGQLTEAQSTLDTMHDMGKRYGGEYTYYSAYMAYVDGRLNDAIQGFESVKTMSAFKDLAPYYLGEIALTQKRYQDAYSIAASYLQGNPQGQVAEMHRIQGMAAYQLNKNKEAVLLLSDYLSRTSQPRVDALYILGVSRYKVGEYAQAVAAFKPVTRTQDDAELKAHAWLQLGFCRLKLGEVEAAQMAFKQAEKYGDVNIREQASYNYAVGLRASDKQAVVSWVPTMEQFIQTYPKSKYSDEVLGYLVDGYLKQQKYAASLAAINKMKHPGNRVLQAKAQVLVKLSEGLIDKKQFDEARQYLVSAQKLKQYDPQTAIRANYWLADMEQKQKKYQQATTHYTLFMQQYADKQSELYAMGQYNLGYCAFNQKQYSQAIDLFQKFLSMPGAHKVALRGDALNRLADSFYYQRDLTKSVDYYQQALKVYPDGGDYALYQMSMIAGIEENYKKKEQLSLRLQQTYPESTYVLQAQYEQGRALVQQHKEKEAIACFNQLIKQHPKHVLACKSSLEIGVLHYQAKRYDQAIAAYKKTIYDYPSTEEAQLAFEDLQSIYIQRNQVAAFATLAKQLPGVTPLKVAAQDSLTFMAAERRYIEKDYTAARISLEHYVAQGKVAGRKAQSLYYLSKIALTQKSGRDMLRYTSQLIKMPENSYTMGAWQMRAEEFEKHQQWDEASNGWSQVARLAHDDMAVQWDAYRRVAHCAYLAKQYRRVINASPIALKAPQLEASQSRQLRLEWGKSAWALKDYDMANKVLTSLNNLQYKEGAEATYLLAQLAYMQKQFVDAEKQAKAYIQKGTPHAYWLARTFILLADVYIHQEKWDEAKQYLQGLVENYQAHDDISELIDRRLHFIEEKTKVSTPTTSSQEQGGSKPSVQAKTVRVKNV